MSTIAGSHFVHEVAVEHGLTHLLSIVVDFTCLSSRAKTICLGLVEYVLLLSTYGWEHFMNTRVIG